MAARTVMNLAGEVYGQLTIIAKADRLKGKLAWLCRCKCGTEKVVIAESLRSGKTVSCGCYGRSGISNLKHGKCRSRAYSTWQNMNDRCYNPNNSHFKNYGGRGVALCDRWKEFANFYADMGDPPDGHSIDRFPDNDGNYEPGNCRWATDLEQAQNTTRSKFVEIDGRTQTLSEWSRESGVNYGTILSRLESGMTAREAVFSAPQSFADIGRRCGKLRFSKLTAEQRTALAKKAAAASVRKRQTKNVPA